MIGFRRLASGLAIFTIALSGVAADPPPTRVHYQGVLLDNAGNPVSSASTIYFSIYQGGDATSFPSAGTLKYREHATITPDANGIFDHPIGTGIVDSGALNAALFNTADPLFLEIAVGNPATAGNALLPRARFSSVGYAFVADNAVGDITPKTVGISDYGQVIDAAGNWTGRPVSAVGLPSAPRVTAVTDETGGRLVIGDILKIDGANLANSRVLIGGRVAPLVGAATAGLIRCQVPAGTRRGLNAVTLVDTTGANASVTVAHVDVRRLVVAVRSNGGTGRVSVLDAGTREIVTQFNLSGAVRNEDQSGISLTLQSGFGHQGALLLIPSGNNNIYAVDLTANPPTQADVLSIGSGNRGVAVSPDGVVAVACDFGGSSGNQIRTLPLGQTAPPYGASLLSAGTGLESTEIPAGLGATGVVFMGDSQFFVLGRTSPSRIISYYRTPGTVGSNIRDVERIPLADLNASGLSDEIGAGTEPVRLQLTPDRSRLLVTNRAQNNLQAIFAAPFWPAAFNPSGGSAPAGSLPLKMAASPDNRTLFVATRNDSDSQISDRLKIFQIVGETLTFRGEIVGPHYNNDNESFQIADIEPVDGDVLAVATNDDKIYMPTVTGGVVGIDNDDRNDNTTYMSLTAPIDLSDSVRDCVELVFQP